MADNEGKCRRPKRRTLSQQGIKMGVNTSNMVFTRQPFLSAEGSTPIEMATFFVRERDALEKEGVYIGGWSVKNALIPKKTDGKHGN
jgi:hypothetical protein